MLFTLQNGLPFWWLRGDTRFDKHILQSIDPGGLISASVNLSHCIGGVIYVAASTSVNLGEVSHARGRDIIIIGEPSGEITPRLKELEALLLKSTFTVKCSTRIRDDYVRSYMHLLCI